MNINQLIRECNKCGESKPLLEFPVYNRKTGGRRHTCKSCNRKRVANHHKANKAHRLEMARKRYAKNPAAHWTPERRARANEMARKRNTELRNQVVRHYGGKCVCCGESGELFLTLDHVDNNGHEMRRDVHGNGSSGIYRWIIKNDYPDAFQVLCMNCNFGKARNGGVCPHKEGSTTIPKGSRAK